MLRVYLGDSETPVEVTRSQNRAIALALALTGWEFGKKGEWQVVGSEGRIDVRGEGGLARIEKVGARPREKKPVQADEYKTTIPGRPTPNGWRTTRALRYIPAAPKPPATTRSDTANIRVTDLEGNVVGDVVRVPLQVGMIIPQLPSTMDVPEEAVYAYAYVNCSLVAVRDLRAPVARL